MVEKKFNFQVFGSLDSSNCKAKELALTSHPEIWILVLNQTKGRGRRGKKWHSSPNNFTASYLFYPNVLESTLPMFSYVAGLALYDSVNKLGLGTNHLCLKWPNDLLLNGKKIGGVLIESVSRNENRRKALVIGFGLNLVSCPPLRELGHDAYSATYLKGSSILNPTVKDFLEILMPTFNFWSNIYLKQGFKRICKEFLNRTFPIGKEIQVKTVDRSIWGKFSGIKNDGSLILESSTDVIYVTAGDVVLIGK